MKDQNKQGAIIAARDALESTIDELDLIVGFYHPPGRGGDGRPASQGGNVKNNLDTLY